MASLGRHRMVGGAVPTENGLAEPGTWGDRDDMTATRWRRARLEHQLALRGDDETPESRGLEVVQEPCVPRAGRPLDCIGAQNPVEVRHGHLASDHRSRHRDAGPVHDRIAGLRERPGRQCVDAPVSGVCGPEGTRPSEIPGRTRDDADGRLRAADVGGEDPACTNVARVYSAHASAL